MWPLEPYEGAQTAPDTTLHVRRAVDGDEESVAWMVEHFTPALLCQVAYRLPPVLRSEYDPEDIVQDVWVRSLPRLADLVARGERYTPVLLAFLSSTLLNRINSLVATRVRRNRLAGWAQDTSDSPLPAVSAETIGVVTRAARNETHRAVLEVIERLGERERAVVTMHGIEGLPHRTVAQRLGISESNAATIYTRALDDLRRRCSRSVFAELSDD